MNKYLAYGSNLHPLRLQQRVPSAKHVGVVGLSGWSLHFHKRSNRDGSGKCNILKGDSEGTTVYGAVYEISKEEVPRLDNAEDLGYGYEKAHITTDEHGEVFLYLATDSHIDDSLLPFEWYKNYVIEGAEYHGFPKDYLEVLTQVDSVRDQDEHRRKENESLIQALRGKVS